MFVQGLLHDGKAVLQLAYHVGLVSVDNLLVVVSIGNVLGVHQKTIDGLDGLAHHIATQPCHADKAQQENQDDDIAQAVET